MAAPQLDAPAASPADSFERAQVLVLSSIDWAAAWQRHQLFASQLAEAGHEVFFVENTGFRNPSAADWGRVRAKLRKLAAAEAAQPAGLPPRLKVVSPAVLPPTFPLFRAVNRLALLPALVRKLGALGLRPGAMAIVYSPTPTNLALLDLLRPSVVVYDCASNFRGHPHAPRDIARVERRLMRRSDLVITDSDFLYQQKKGEHPCVVQLHQGVSPLFFGAKPPDPGWKRICYYGTWTPDLDERYLNALAEAGFEVTFSGFVRGPLPPFSPKIKVLPPTDIDKLIDRLQEQDVFVLPHKINEFMKGVIPAKIYEYLALGRPVLAVPLPSLTPMREHLYISDDPAEWVRRARELPRLESEQRRQARIAAARDHTHEAEFQRLLAHLRRAWSARGRRETAWWRAGSMLELAQGVGWIGVLYGAARGLTLAGQVIAGRLLGPLEYGRANLVVAMAAFLQVPPMLGFPSALAKYPAEEPDQGRRARLVGTGLLAFGLWSLLCGGVFIAFRRPAALALGRDPELLGYAGLLAFATSLYTVGASPLLGLKRFAQRGATEALYGMTALVVILALFASGENTYRALVLGLTTALLAASAAAIWALGSQAEWTIDRAALRKLLSYSALASINLLTAACVIAPGRLTLARHASAAQVGIFSAYFTGTVHLSLAATTMISAVLLPLASSPQGQAQVRLAARRLTAAAAACGLALFLASGAAALSLFGRNYPIRAGWLSLFAVGADLALLHGLASTLFAARDLQGLRVSVLGASIAAAANVALCLVLVPRFGISGAAASLVVSYTVGLAYYGRMFNLRTHDDEREERSR